MTRCWKCGGPLVTGRDGDTEVDACLACNSSWTHVATAADIDAGSGPAGAERADPCKEPPDAIMHNAAGEWIGTESALVEAIRQALTVRGYIVRRCNQWRADRSGSDVCPDLLVWRPMRMLFPKPHDTFTPWAICMEVKTARGRLSKQQQIDADEGRIVIVRSVADALSAVGWNPRQVEEAMRD
jgi:hypothetical protein